MDCSYTRVVIFHSMFTADELEWVRSVTLWDVIVNSTDVEPESLQREVFFWNDGDPCPQPGQIEPSTLEPCSYLKGFDYFEVSNTLRVWVHLRSPFVALLRIQSQARNSAKLKTK